MRLSSGNVRLNPYICNLNRTAMIDENKALKSIAQGEGQHFELKREVSSKVRDLSEGVCVLANATG